MADLAERHEIRVRAGDSTIVFTAESEDGRLFIRQEADGRKGRQVCSIALSDPEELAAFFKGLRRMLASLGHDADAPRVAKRAAKAGGSRTVSPDAQKRSRPENGQSSPRWDKGEERELRRRFQAGESIREIARALDRAPREIESQLERLGVLQDV